MPSFTTFGATRLFTFAAFTGHVPATDYGPHEMQIMGESYNG